MDSIFGNPAGGGEKGAVTINEAAEAMTPPMMDNAAVDELYFGQEAEPAAEAESGPQRVVAEVPPEITQTLQALKQNVDVQQSQLNQMGQSMNAQAQMAQMANWEMAKRQQQEYVQQFNPPEAPSDIDDLITDPEKVKSFIEDSRQWALQVARAEYAPVAQRLNAFEQLAEPVLAQSRDLAWDKAMRKLAAKGFQEEQMPHLRQLADAVAAQTSPGNWSEQMRHTMNPDSMAYAAEIAWEQSGAPMPVRNPEAPPVNAPGESRVTRGREEGKAPVLGEVEKRLGIKMSKTSIDKFNAYKREHG